MGSSFLTLCLPDLIFLLVPQFGFLRVCTNHKNGPFGLFFALFFTLMTYEYKMDERSPSDDLSVKFPGVYFCSLGIVIHLACNSTCFISKSNIRFPLPSVPTNTFDLKLLFLGADSICMFIFPNFFKN